MKKVLLLTGISAISLAAFAADIPTPTKLGDSFIQNISPNGQYAVSNLTDEKIGIFDLASGKQYFYEIEDMYSEESYYCGIGKCISNNGILVGGRTSSEAAYWKDGEWYPLEVGGSISYSNSANAITPDGSRICGMLGSGNIGTGEEDVLMVVPCIWNAEGDGFGDPIILPYPEHDIIDRVPQYIKAIDISGDGKTIIGMIREATGRFEYPIIYKEDAEGKWSYEIPNKDLLMPEGFKMPEYPGEFKEPYPNYENYMTSAELNAYNEALNNYYDLGDYSLPYPEFIDFMTPENREEYMTTMEAWQIKFDTWMEKFNTYMDALDELIAYMPGYQINSVRISDDGLTWGSTIAEGDGGWGSTVAYNVWVFDMNSDSITKYDQQDDLCLTYLANDGVGVASTPVGAMSASNSFILKNGEVSGMYDWMNSRAPEYASWMKENMEFEYEGFDDNWDLVFKKEFMTGHATSTPDLSYVALSVQNIGFVDDYDSIGVSFIFDINTGAAVNELRPADEAKTIYDLSGRQLKEVSAPGIYIINGEKKVVR